LALCQKGLTMSIKWIINIRVLVVSISLLLQGCTTIKIKRKSFSEDLYQSKAIEKGEYTNYQQHFKFACKSGEYLNEFHSNILNENDRTWKFNCADGNGIVTADCNWSDYVDVKDEPLNMTCSNSLFDGVITGIASFYRDQFRQWKIRCCRSKQYEPALCKTERDWLNKASNNIQHKASDGHIFDAILFSASNYPNSSKRNVTFINVDKAFGLNVTDLVNDVLLSLDKSRLSYPYKDHQREELYKTSLDLEESLKDITFQELNLSSLQEILKGNADQQQLNYGSRTYFVGPLTRFFNQVNQAMYYFELEALETKLTKRAGIISTNEKINLVDNQETNVSLPWHEKFQQLLPKLSKSVWRGKVEKMYQMATMAKISYNNGIKVLNGDINCHKCKSLRDEYKKLVSRNLCQTCNTYYRGTYIITDRHVGNYSTMIDNIFCRFSEICCLDCMQTNHPQRNALLQVQLARKRVVEFGYQLKKLWEKEDRMSKTNEMNEGNTVDYQRWFVRECRLANCTFNKIEVLEDPHVTVKTKIIGVTTTVGCSEGVTTYLVLGTGKTDQNSTIATWSSQYGDNWDASVEVKGKKGFSFLGNGVKATLSAKIGGGGERIMETDSAKSTSEMAGVSSQGEAFFQGPGAVLLWGTINEHTYDTADVLASFHGTCKQGDQTFPVTRESKVRLASKSFGLAHYSVRTAVFNDTSKCTPELGKCVSDINTIALNEEEMIRQFDACFNGGVGIIVG